MCQNFQTIFEFNKWPTNQSDQTFFGGLIAQHVNNNIILVANKLLDTIELKEKHYVHNIDAINWRRSIDKINGSLFYKEAFGKDDTSKFLFPSITEICTQDFERVNDIKYKELINTFLRGFSKDSEEDDGQKKFIEALKSDSKKDGAYTFNPVKYSPYHKYIVVVQADGDNIGKTIGKIGNDTQKVRDFSSALFEFALGASELISNYGGKSVYIGGDDLFFFAPIAVHNGNADNPRLKTIFGLINDLDKLFKNKIIESPSLRALYDENTGVLSNDIPSMSYGVSMTYSKYPLNEAKENAYNLLMEIKQLEYPEKKNRINFKLHKHSGQGFGFMVDKNVYHGQEVKMSLPKSFCCFLDLVNDIPLNENLLSSVIFKIGPLHALLHSIGKDKVRLTDFFDQEFELEELRKVQKSNLSFEKQIKLDFLDNIIYYFHQLCLDFPSDNLPMATMETDPPKSNIAKLYSTLRFLKHLTDDDNE